MAGIGADARRPWPGKRIAVMTKMEPAQRRRVQRNRRSNGGGGRSDRVPYRSPFKGGINEEIIIAQVVHHGFVTRFESRGAHRCRE
jgi:hypothetical protein